MDSKYETNCKKINRMGVGSIYIYNYRISNINVVRFGGIDENV